MESRGDRVRAESGEWNWDDLIYEFLPEERLVRLPRQPIPSISHIYF